MGPDYSKYSIEELRDSLAHINEEKAPDNYKRLIEEFKNRKTEYKQYDLEDENIAVKKVDLSVLNKNINSLKQKLDTIEADANSEEYISILKDFESKKIIRQNHIHGIRKEIPIFQESKYYKKISTDVDENKHFLKVLFMMVPVLFVIFFEGYDFMVHELGFNSLPTISIIFLIITLMLWANFRKILSYKEGYVLLKGSKIEIKYKDKISSYNIIQIEKLKISANDRYKTNSISLNIAGKNISFNQNTPKYATIKSSLKRWIKSNIINFEHFIENEKH